MLAGHLKLANTPEIRLVVCGGAALLATKVVSRTTKDVDIVALRSVDGTLAAPVPLPGFLLQAAAVVARDLGLEPDWLNNGPSRDEGGLFQMGLPAGFGGRLTGRVYGPQLTVYFIGRKDQIFFKVFSASDRGGVDLDDLAALKPSADELEEAARWSMGINVSEGYRRLLQELLKDLGYESVAARI
jgi:hypothetical protein